MDAVTDPDAAADADPAAAATTDPAGSADAPAAAEGLPSGAAAARLARRYPPAPRRRWWIPVAVVLALAGVVWLGVAGGYWATGVVTGRVDAFSVRSDTLIDVTVSIDRPDPTRGAQCLLYAQAVSYDRVGEVTVDLPAGGVGLTQLQIGLRTFKRATTAVIESCHATG